MDLEDILNVLNDLDPSKLPMFLDMVNILGKYSYDNYIEVWRQALDNVTHESHQEIMSMIETLTLEELISVINAHGIQVKETITIRKCLEILDGIIAIEHTEHLEESLQVIKEHPLATDCFAELIAVANFKHPDNFLIDISYVEEELIETIKEMLYSKLHFQGELDVVPEVDIKNNISNYRNLKSLYAKSGLDFILAPDMFIEHVEQIGLPFDTYLSHFKSICLTQLMATDNRLFIKTVYDVAGFICLSSEGLNSLMGQVTNITEKIIADLDKKKTFTENLGQLLQRINHGNV